MNPEGIVRIEFLKPTDVVWKDRQEEGGDSNDPQHFGVGFIFETKLIEYDEKLQTVSFSQNDEDEDHWYVAEDIPVSNFRIIARQKIVWEREPE